MTQPPIQATKLYIFTEFYYFYAGFIGIDWFLCNPFFVTNRIKLLADTQFTQMTI